jgi:tetratricopeptide (TPR) repeat protein
VLRLEPNNRSAKLGLVLDGTTPPDQGLIPVPLIPRKWSDAFQKRSQETGPGKIIRRLAYIGASAVVLGFIMIGFISPRLRSYGYFGGIQLTVTPHFETLVATSTLLPTNTPRVVTPTPTFIGPTPLWMFLEATYTATPLYVNTPHPASEAYRAGIRAFNNGNYDEMLIFMEQATQSEPQSADTHFYVGEANLLLNNPESALYAYDKAIEANPNFAPAYLGRAKAMAAIDPEFDIEGDLTQAIELDPSLAPAYLELIAYQLSVGDHKNVLEDLEIVERLIPDSPLIYLYRSQVLLELEEFEQALEAAQLAYELDETILEVYLTLGNLNLQAGNPDQASHFLDIYLRYVRDDAEAWATYGRAVFEGGDNFEQAMQALDLALILDENSFNALLYRGLTYLEVGEGQLAVNDLFIARNFDRDSFDASLALARALHLAERIDDAISQFTGSEQLVISDDQQAEVYYWRAQAYHSSGDYKSAANDYQALLDLPEGTAAEAWTDFAQEYILKLTPTPTMTPSPPNTPTIILPTSTSTMTPTASPTSTPRPTATTNPRR